MRKKKDRTHQILEILSKKNKAEVSELASQVGVSQVTLRKDLDELEQKGIIRREHGFARLENENDLNTRLAYHYEKKRRIAQQAADLVKEEETIMIENGSCCALLAEALGKSGKKVTIITNSAFIANFVRSYDNLQIILLGGTYQKDAQVMVGPLIRQAAQNFLVDKFFIGVDGYSESNGFLNKDHMRAQSVRDMAVQAEKIIVLTESEKFGKQAAVPLHLDKVYMVITDSQNQTAPPLPDETKLLQVSLE